MCFSALWVAWTVIWLLGIVGVVLLVLIVLPWLCEVLGIAVDARVWRILKIILVCFIAGPFLVWLLYDLYVCSVGFPRLR